MMAEPATPFVLTCQECDAGDGIECAEQALLLRWEWVLEDSDGLSWNHIGLCPDCADGDNRRSKNDG